VTAVNASLPHSYTRQPAVLRTSARVNTGVELPAVQIDLDFINAVLGTNKPGNNYVRTCYCPWLNAQRGLAHSVRPSSLHARPAVLSGDGGTSNTPWSGASVPRIALSSHRLTTWLTKGTSSPGSLESPSFVSRSLACSISRTLRYEESCRSR
jgi:hypothetical protein